MKVMLPSRFVMSVVTMAVALPIAFTPLSGGDCSWSDGYMRADLYWSSYGRIATTTATVDDVIRRSKYRHRRLTVCFERGGIGAVLDSILAAIRRTEPIVAGSDNTIVMIVRRVRTADTISFANHHSVTINSKQYRMTKEMLRFIGERMPYGEAAKILADTGKVQ